MKTKFKYFTMAIVALLMVGFSNCSSDDTPQIDTEETKTVFLKISNGQPSTRAVGSSLATNKSPVQLTSGHIYFTAASGVIIKHYTLGGDATTDENITIADLIPGTPIKNLPGSTKNVYIVGNSDPIDSGSKIITSGSISEVQQAVLNVADQADITNTNLYGTSEIGVVDGSQSVAVTVNLAPTVAVFEITDIKTKEGSIITGFEVEGIFVDNYYEKANVSGAVVETPVDKGTTPADFKGPVPAEASSSNIHDWYTANYPTYSGSAIGPEASKVWGYNIFAGEYNKGISDHPRIIIRLKNVKMGEGTAANEFPNPQFITISGFSETSGGAAMSGNILPGHIYTIAAGALQFDESNLAPIPNVKTIEVAVTVKLAEWTSKAVHPIL